MPTWHTLFILSLIASFIAAFGAWADPSEIRLLFTGDILLSRNVQKELEQRSMSPWGELSDVFGQADLVVGNLEGAVGESNDCLPSGTTAPCFNISESFMPLLASAPFRALSIENNHNYDLGAKGRADTIQALDRVGLIPLTYEASPRFLRFRDVTIGIIALNLVPRRDGGCQSIPAVGVRQKLGLARSLANLVVVYVHWGSELLDWPNKSQRASAKWLIGHGADLIVGHHPHVVQTPEMIEGKPVFFSLGNHLFDQKYPATKEGLIADCRITQGVLRCGGLRTGTARGSFFPHVVEGTQYNLQPVHLRSALQISGITLRPVATDSGKGGEISLEGISHGKRLWQTRANRLAGLSAARFDGENEFLFTLEWHHSPIDDGVALRPYVYTATPQGLVARWRGSALAWPLLDAVVLPDDETTLCGLHRGNSFIDLQPDSRETRVAAYRWNGFGFSGVRDAETTEKCRKCFEMGNEEGPPALGGR